MSKKNNKLGDTDITIMLGLPRTTIQDWKNTESTNWRKKLYTFIKSHTYEELEQKLNSLKEH